MRNNKGFTLVELLAVIVIMGILMMVAIPSVTRVIENSRKDSFIDIAKSYANAARNLWTTDNLTCDGTLSSAVDDGDYYILINSKEDAKDSLPILVDQGGKSSWGNRDVSGYVRVNVSTTSGEDTDGDGTYEVEPRRVTKFYVALSDGTHGLIDNDTLMSDELKRGNVIMSLSSSDLKKIEFTLDDGRLNCTRNSSGMYVCLDITPVNSISGICTDDRNNSGYLSTITVNPVSFATDDWATITAALKLGSHPYSVGDTKTVNMGDFGTHKIRLSNLTPCDGSLSSQTACGVVLEFADVVVRYNMNPAGEYKGGSYPAGYNVDGWPASAMRSYVNSDIYAALPNELKSAIISTNVVSGHGSTNSNNFFTTDKLYLLSTKEVWGEGTSDTTGYDSAKDSTRQLDYYRNQLVTVTNYSLAKKKYNTSESFVWLRAATANYNQYFYGVHVDGRPGYVGAYFARGVSPAFRIA